MRQSFKNVQKKLQDNKNAYFKRHFDYCQSRTEEHLLKGYTLVFARIFVIYKP